MSAKLRVAIAAGVTVFRHPVGRRKSSGSLGRLCGIGDAVRSGVTRKISKGAAGRARYNKPVSATVRSYNVVLEPDPDGGYVAVVPAFPGCYSQGETVEEALAGAREAIELTIEDMEAAGEPIPDPAGEVVHEVAVGS